MFKKLTVLALLSISSTVFAGNLTPHSAVYGTGVISYVIDGDTMIVNADKRSDFIKLRNAATEKKELDHFYDKYSGFKVRLGNINTPESVHRNKALNTVEGKYASDYVRKNWENKKVKFVCWDFGHYGRPICSLSSNGVDLGADLIEKGHSTYEYKWGKHPFLHSMYIKKMMER
ncbi:thermonuclease family protein [Vibrio metschnikovii]|uniref:Thermonuclease family protein n=1 Tax=Vibrio metschnikovii TaxID=28172 RepID=A0A9X0R826_VIBME|nr:thermonuclease family protein [Vibrio metschnikovii]MBC5851289.1 thermonuclease family protein [Vibrio metschnikovii]